MMLALSILCEHPERKTGLTTLFHEFVAHSLVLFPDLHWLIFAGPNQPWTVEDPRVQVCRDYPANDRLAWRLLADHLLVPAAARRAGADALLTVGFLPLRNCLPVVMHVFSLQHVRGRNKVGSLRSLYRAIAVRRGLARARLIVTNSQWAASEILRDCPGCASRLTVSYEGLQHEQFHPECGPQEASRVQKEFGFEPGYLLWVSNFYAYKQAPLLLEAYARLAPELRRRHPLVLVGGDWHGGLGEAKERADQLGISADLRFLGWVGDEWLAPLYRQARAFVLASREETFGRCVAEAMACGTPCVVNAIPIMAEVTGGHAVLTDFASVADAAQALERICTDEPLREKLRDDGRQWVQKFRFDALARERITAIAARLRA